MGGLSFWQHNSNSITKHNNNNNSTRQEEDPKQFSVSVEILP